MAVCRSLEQIAHLFVVTLILSCILLTIVRSTEGQNTFDSQPENETLPSNVSIGENLSSESGHLTDISVTTSIQSDGAPDGITEDSDTTELYSARTIFQPTADEVQSSTEEQVVSDDETGDPSNSMTSQSSIITAHPTIPESATSTLVVSNNTGPSSDEYTLIYQTTSTTGSENSNDPSFPDSSPVFEDTTEYETVNSNEPPSSNSPPELGHTTDDETMNSSEFRTTTYLPITTTTEILVTANSSMCPVVITTPQFISNEFGTSATFSSIVETNASPTLYGRWLKIQTDRTELIDISTDKYSGSRLLPFPVLTINEVNFDDDVNYQFQVRIDAGWCLGNIVNLEVRGILQFNDSCNMTKECNQNMQLECSLKYKSCMCNSTYYHRNGTCYHRNNLMAIYQTSNITTHYISVWWRQPSVDSTLVQSYVVRLTENWGSIEFEEFAGRDTNYTFVSKFTPGYLFYFEIVSTVLLTNPMEMINVTTSRIPLVVDPLPPGPIDIKASDFHPEKLRLIWAVPKNNTYVGRYRITILGWYYSLSNIFTWPDKLEPGENYTVTITARSWHGNSFAKESVGYIQHIQTLRTPKLEIGSTSFNVPLLSTIKINAAVNNRSDFPPTTEIKWQKRYYWSSFPTDINITNPKYNGSTLDLSDPRLVINKVDFNNDHRYYYQCVGRNEEGWGTSNAAYVTLYGSLKFLEQCTHSQECEPNKHLQCRSSKCLCSGSYYHKDSVCFSRYRLYISNIEPRKTAGELTITWQKPLYDNHLVSGYTVVLSARKSSWWGTVKTVNVGNTTEYKTPCKLQPGRMHRFEIQYSTLHNNPTESFNYTFASHSIILDPMPPGKIDRTESNFSADHLYIKWDKSGQNTFLNHYKVVINGHQQITFGSFPGIYWKQGLIPGSIYNVTITAVSHGDDTSGPWSGTAESDPYLDWIEIEQADAGAYAYMPYGERDNLLRGDDVTSPPLNSPTTVYVGDGSEKGFNFVIIGSNGIIGLGEVFNSITIRDMDANNIKNRQIICPFWTDLLTLDTIGNVYYKTYQRGQDAENNLFLRKANEIVRQQFRDFPQFEASWLVKVTWENMTLFGDKSRTATFQCLIITDGLSTFTVVNYIDVDLKRIKKKKISIGYRYKRFFMKNHYSNKNAAFQMSKNPGNRGVHGFWIHKLTTGVPLNKEEKECFDWYTTNKEKGVSEQLTPILNVIECPCDSRLLRFDPRYAINRFDRENRVLCYASMVVGRNVECCFRMHGTIDHLSTLERSKPAVGTVLQYNPFFERQLYSANDLKAREMCCKAGHCQWYYEVRPIPFCYRRSPFQPGINFGDPHIRTLDGKNYTFNGYGEYTMMTIAKDNTRFDFQARTDLATTANGTVINATIFSAFVAQDHTGSHVQIEMSRDKTKLIIRGNGHDLTRRFESANFTFLTQNLSIRWENETICASFLQSSISLKVSLGVRFLISETIVDSAYKGFVKGLMGNFDGNSANDFILPNGTILDETTLQKEKDIYYKFGQQWAVHNLSLFHYGTGLTYNNFSHPEFEPVFLDEVDEEKLNAAKDKCGPNPSQSCIFDFLATGDIALASSSAKEEISSINDVAIIENETPNIKGNETIYAEVQREVTLIFTAEDDGEEIPTFKVLKQPEGFKLNSTSGIATWTPQSINISEISISVVDIMGAESPSLDTTIILCSRCSERGSCDYVNVRRTENVLVYHASCDCRPGYSGDSCEVDTDACLLSPCPLDRNCTDLSPEEEDKLGRGYNCSDCPNGFTEIDNKCEDIDECTIENVCNETTAACENTEGSFICNCVSGYRKLDNMCEDVDECAERTSNCESLCRNTQGGFECDCHPGFALNAEDKASCDKTDVDPCKTLEKTCEYTCSNVTGKLDCICPIGYQLDENGENCTDLNECEVHTPCEQECNNTDGSFHCVCGPGFTLHVDKTSCTECEPPYYGENCSHVFESGPGVDTCNSVSGCTCLSGWTGESCDVDIDECSAEQSICGTLKVCKNLEGSYSCNCREGFQNNGVNCIDIDECSDPILNDCPENTNCKNTHGNYTCMCIKGFQRIDSTCRDVDECENKIHDCSQICINTYGDYECECEFGYELQNDRKRCEKVKDVCTLFPELNCTYGCILKQDSTTFRGYCFCESGFELGINNSTCEDVNECTQNATCNQTCNNTHGSFECGCLTGYTLLNDGRSCEVCSNGFYGDNCLKTCRCDGGSDRCDPVRGCVCKQGWTGESCSEDINECNNSTNSSNPCEGDNELCINYVGSYNCECREGFNHSNGICEDIDECQNSSTCEQNCSNTEGGFYCTCRTGFDLHNSSKCVDIDECSTASCHNCSNFPGGFNCSCNEGYSLNLTTTAECNNIDECLDGSNNCSEEASCTDTEGGYYCNCHKGFKGDGYTCIECDNFTFGEQCLENCTCNVDTTKDCDTRNGTCYCKDGWTGSDCSQDVDECKNSSYCDVHLEDCYNVAGSARCECRYGNILLNNHTECIAPKPPQNASEWEIKIKLELRIGLNVTKDEIHNNNIEWLEKTERALEEIYNKSIRGFTKVTVLSIRFGSVFADHEVFANANESENVKMDIANQMWKFLTKKSKLRIGDSEADIISILLKDENGMTEKNFTDPSTLCSDLKVNCPGDADCVSNSDGLSCVKPTTADLSVYVIVLGVSIPLLITAIVLMIICLYHRRNPKDSETGSVNKYMVSEDGSVKNMYTELFWSLGSNPDKGHGNANHSWNRLNEDLKIPGEFRIKRPTVCIRKN